MVFRSANWNSSVSASVCRRFAGARRFPTSDQVEDLDKLASGGGDNATLR